MYRWELLLSIGDTGKYGITLQATGCKACLPRLLLETAYFAVLNKLENFLYKIAGTNRQDPKLPVDNWPPDWDK